MSVSLNFNSSTFTIADFTLIEQVLGCGLYASLSYGKKKQGRPLSKADTMTLNFMLPRNFTTKAYEGLARLKAFR